MVNQGARSRAGVRSGFLEAGNAPDSFDYVIEDPPPRVMPIELETKQLLRRQPQGASLDPARAGSYIPPVRN